MSCTSRCGSRSRSKDGWAASGSGTTGGSQADSAHVYTVSTRAKAQVVAEDNYWKVPAGGKTAKLLSGDGTGSVAGSGNLVNGTQTDLVAAYNAANSKKLKTTVNWTPSLTAGLEKSAKNLPTELATTTGAGVLTS